MVLSQLRQLNAKQGYEPMRVADISINDNTAILNLSQFNDRLNNQVGKWVGLTLIWDVSPSCLGSM